MRLKNILIVVRDIEASKKYYHDLFGFNMTLDNDRNYFVFPDMNSMHQGVI